MLWAECVSAPWASASVELMVMTVGLNLIAEQFNLIRFGGKVHGARFE